MTRDILAELSACRWDIGAFGRLLGVESHPGQLRFYGELIRRDITRWRPANLTLAVSAGNRAGKTLMLAIAVAHHTMFKIGMRPPDMSDIRELEAWLRAPYHWYHFGIQQEVGELVYNELADLLDGRHEAQRRRGCPLIDALGAPIAKVDLKERGEYRWVVFDPVLGGGQIHFRTTNEKALGSLGKAMNGVSFDECGFEQNLSFIVNEVLHFRRLSTGGPLILTSTPSEGFTQFSDEWKRGDPSDPNREPYRISLRMSTRDNIGYGIDQRVFDQLVAGIPESLIPQNVDGYFIEGRRAFFNHEAVDKAFVKGLPEHEPPTSAGRYVHGIDPALTYDATWSIVLRVDGGKGTGVNAERRGGKQKLSSVVELVSQPHHLYNSNGARCMSGCDVTGFGGKVFKEQLADLHPMRAIEFGGVRSKKLKLLTDLKGLIEQGRLRFPREGKWLELRRQLMGYRLEDKGLATDAVMSLAIAARLMLSVVPEDVEALPFDFFSDEETPAVPEGYRPAPITPLDRRLRRASAVSTMR